MATDSKQYPRKPKSTESGVSRERSAGVIVHTNDDPPAFLLLDYGRYWDYPKGHLEAGEDDLTAARRELFEETGIEAIELDPDWSREIRYFFRKKNKLINKTVRFFLGKVESREVRISHEHSGYGWLGLNEALDKVGHGNAKALLRDAAEHLNLLASDPASDAK
ncbi:MAG: NUDIX domain-containing protein [Planctomycetota bacterium]